MAKKLYDLSVRVGEYQSNGETKGKYQTVGTMFEGDDGKYFLTLARWFNPGGVPFKDGSDSIFVSCFEPRAKGAPVGKKNDDDTPF